METQDAFFMSDFCHKHLTEWFEFGMAPNDWDRERLEEFRTWITANAHKFSYDSSWTSIAHYWVYGA